MKIKKIKCFANGNTIVFGEDGQQLPLLQVSWLLLYIDFLVHKGIEPDGLEILMPNGMEAVVFKIENGYNWLFKQKPVEEMKG